MNKYGWLKQPQDDRDFKSLRYQLINQEILPSNYTLPIKLSIYDQEPLGSCGANGGSSCFTYEAKQKNIRTTFKPSRLFLYYNARAINGWENEDSGVYIRDIFKTLSKEGICSESNMPYDISKFTIKPSDKAYKNAKLHSVTEYAAVENNIDIIKKTVMSGACIEFGFNVYESFESGNWDSTTGIMPIPLPNESLLGGHAVIIIGWSDEKQSFLIQNSWGKNWGLKGLFWMPYSYMISKECDDFWCIEQIK